MTAREPRSEYARAVAAARFILSKTKLRPRVGVVLGSGLGAFGDQLAEAKRIPFDKIPHFPRARAEGHAGRLVVGSLDGVPVAVMQGRVHLYEGHSPQDVIFPMRVMGSAGMGAAVLTNAAGGINPNYRQGCLVVLRDHINLQGINPLTGPNDHRFGPRFFDMSEAYSAALRDAALREGRRLGLPVFEGVYAAVSGPSYETPAEIRFLRAIGADLVGMSTVPEVIAARHLGMEILGISCVTNLAAGLSEGPLSHAEVLETGKRVAGQFVALLRAVIPLIDKHARKRG